MTARRKLSKRESHRQFMARNAKKYWRKRIDHLADEINNNFNGSIEEWDRFMCEAVERVQKSLCETDEDAGKGVFWGFSKVSHDR